MTGITDRAAERSANMMAALGVDLDTSVMRGTVGPCEEVEVALRCAACTEDAACARWLADGSVAHDSAPDYCRNKPLFDRLLG